jgi:beta-lactamase regulating signal transducer with metallopeptidase domain
VSWLEIWFSTQHVERLGWALLHFVWQGAVAAWFLEIALTCLRGRSSQARYLAGCTVMGVMACLPVLTMCLVDVEDASPAVVDRLSAENSTAAQAPPTSQPQLAALAPATRPSSAARVGEVGPVPTTHAVKPEDNAPPAAAKPWVTISFADPESMLRPVLPWLVAAWMMGVITLSTRLLSGWLQAQRLKREGTEQMSLDWEVRFLELCQRLAIRKPVELATSAMAAVPMTIGWLRPIVLVPASALTGLSPRQLEAILAHELAHIRRHDYLFNLVQCVIETLLFYHPAVWWVSRRIRAERENCCDDLAVLACGDALMYAKALTRLEEMRWPSPQLAVAATGGQLLSRIQRLLGVKTSQQPVASRWMAGGMALGVGMFLWLTLGLAWRPAVAHPGYGHPVSKLESTPSGRRAEPSPLRYGWKQGESYSYAVKITLDTGDSSEVLSGNSTYQVSQVTADSITLSHRGHLIPISPPRRGSPFSGGFGRPNSFSPWLGSRGAGGEELRITPAGRIVRTSGDSQLPWALGSLSQLLIEALPAEKTQAWEVRIPCLIDEIADSGLPHSRFMQPQAGKLGADEITAYEIVASLHDLTEIKKQYELKTQELTGGEPRMEMRGEGTFRFDTVRGIPLNMDFEVTLFVRSANAEVKLPMTITYRLLEGKELEQLKSQPPAKPKPLTAEELASAIQDLSAPDRARRNHSAARLALAEPSDQRAKVAQALLPLIEDRDDSTRQWAAKALATWGTAETVPPLVKLLDDSAFAVRHAALDALGASRDSRAAEPVAQRVANAQDRATALRALRALGPSAEAAVRGLLQNPDWSVRVEACRILKDSGGPESVAALEQALQDENALVKQAADEALRAIANRRKAEA